MALSTFVGPTLSTIEDKEEKCPEGEKLKTNLKYLNFPAIIETFLFCILIFAPKITFIITYFVTIFFNFRAKINSKILVFGTKIQTKYNLRSFSLLHLIIFI